MRDQRKAAFLQRLANMPHTVRVDKALRPETVSGNHASYVTRGARVWHFATREELEAFRSAYAKHVQR